MKNQSLPRRLRFARAGLAEAFVGESSFRTHVLATVVVFAGLLWLRPAPLWWAILSLTVALVLAAELVNTAIECLADHLHPETHPRIRVVKDCAAAAVLVVSLAALAVGAAFVVDLLR